MVRVMSVQPLDDYRLRIDFSDGLSRVVDLEDRLWGPMFEPLKDPSYFRQVRVDEDAGTIAWPNGLDLDPDVLHGDYLPDRPGLHELSQQAAG
ncbi:MAG: DUF2442 domain-containing protein [Candidatus Dormibacteraceae bacterium]